MLQADDAGLIKILTGGIPTHILFCAKSCGIDASHFLGPAIGTDGAERRLPLPFPAHVRYG